MSTMATDKRVLVTKPMIGLVAMQVCAVKDATDEEILTACNRENPAGTTNGWTSVVRDTEEGSWSRPPETAPVACADNPERVHFLVLC